MDIHKDQIIGEVVGMFPEATEIMLGYGLHCVGCHVNMYETIEQGMLGHGFTEEQMNDLIEELNEAWEELNGEGGDQEISPEAEQMDCEVTEIALQKVIDVAQAEEKGGFFLRIKARNSGNKIRFAMDFEETSSEFDKVLVKGKDKNQSLAR